MSGLWTTLWHPEWDPEVHGPGTPPSDLDTLTREGAEVVALADVHLDGTFIDRYPIVAGSVDYDASARILRSCAVTLLGEVPAGPTDPLAPAGSTIHLWRGARDWTGQELVEPVGRYAFDESSIDRADRLVNITGYDFSQLVSDARWEQPWQINAGTNLVTAITAALQSRLPTALWQPLNAVSTTVTVPATVWGEERDNDPWADLQGLAAAAGMTLTFSRTGQATLQPIPDPDTAPVVWDFTVGTEPTYLSGAKSLFGRSYNVVVARGEPADDTAPVEATAVDDDPFSGSYVGRYRRPYFMTSSYITTVGQAVAAARGQLNAVKGLTEQVTIECVPLPQLDVGQVVRAVDPELEVDARYVIDTMHLPLTPGRGRLTTRRRRL